MDHMRRKKPRKMQKKLGLVNSKVKYHMGLSILSMLFCLSKDAFSSDTLKINVYFNDSAIVKGGVFLRNSNGFSIKLNESIQTQILKVERSDTNQISFLFDSHTINSKFFYTNTGSYYNWYIKKIHMRKPSWCQFRSKSRYRYYNLNPSYNIIRGYGGYGITTLIKGGEKIVEL